MRTYGRDINGVWQEITDINYLWLATLAQTLRLQTQESPFFANYGIPGRDSIMTQIAPDAAIAKTQDQYSPYFSSLTVIKDNTATDPTYRINAVFQNGVQIQSVVYS
jgi:hypothetical protein